MFPSKTGDLPDVTACHHHETSAELPAGVSSGSACCFEGHHQTPPRADPAQRGLC